MSSRSILIVGGNGFVGSYVARSLSGEHRVSCTHQGAFTPIPGVQYYRLTQLGDKNACKALVNKIEPEVVIYCAGSHDVLDAEQKVQKTQLAHSAGVTNIFATSDTYKSKFIYISSDHVFSGAEGNYHEESTAIPTSQLGKAKLSSENFLRSRSLNFVILRCAPLLGRGPLEHPSFIDQIREAALLKKKVHLSSKSIHNPVHIQFLIRTIQHVVTEDVRNKYLHLGGLEKVSMAELGKAVLQVFGLDPATVETQDVAAPALQSDYSLNFSQTLKLLDAEPLHLQDSLEKLKT